VINLDIWMSVGYRHIWIKGSHSSIIIDRWKDKGYRLIECLKTTG